MQRRLAIAAALVHACRVVFEYAGQEVGAIEVCGSTGIRHCARGQQPLRRGRAGRVQRMKATCPPATLPVWISTELQQHIDDSHVVAARKVNERGRIKRKEWFV